MVSVNIVIGKTGGEMTDAKVIREATTIFNTLVGRVKNGLTLDPLPIVSELQDGATIQIGDSSNPETSPYSLRSSNTEHPTKSTRNRPVVSRLRPPSSDARPHTSSRLLAHGLKWRVRSPLSNKSCRDRKSRSRTKHKVKKLKRRRPNQVIKFLKKSTQWEAVRQMDIKRFASRQISRYGEEKLLEKVFPTSRAFSGGASRTLYRRHAGDKAEQNAFPTDTAEKWSSIGQINAVYPPAHVSRCTTLNESPPPQHGAERSNQDEDQLRHPAGNEATLNNEDDMLPNIFMELDAVKNPMSKYIDTSPDAVYRDLRDLGEFLERKLSLQRTITEGRMRRTYLKWNVRKCTKVERKLRWRLLRLEKQLQKANDHIYSIEMKLCKETSRRSRPKLKRMNK